MDLFFNISIIIICIEKVKYHSRNGNGCFAGKNIHCCSVISPLRDDLCNVWNLKDILLI